MVTTDDESLWVQYERLSGKLDVLAARLEARDDSVQQLVQVMRDQAMRQDAEVGELKALLREQVERCDRGLNVVRADLQDLVDHVRQDAAAALTTHARDAQRRLDAHMAESKEQRDRLATRVEQLSLWRARVGGIAAASSVLSSVLTAAVLKALGTS